ncbi:MAG: hypothetical protein NVS4B3_08630 [Gemmatimonadaceae bacterium]
MLGGRTRNGGWGVMVVSLTRGDTLFAQNAGDLMHPASTMKLFTTALALERFGPDYHFSTDVLRDGEVGPDGMLHGNLYLRGGGDPALSNRFLRGDPGAPMELLARFVAGQGIKGVVGDLVADASAFETRKIPEGWRTRYLGLSYAAPVSALSLNENVVWVRVEPGGTRGAPGRVFLEPSSSTYPVTSSVRTNTGRGASVVVRRTGAGIDVRGWIGAQSLIRRYELVVDDPPAFAAGSFRDALAAQGITMTGRVRTGMTPLGASLVTTLPSPPLARLVAVMNRESVNHYAELLFRDVAHADATGEGSAERANRGLKRFLRDKVGADSASVYAADGSGLSTLDMFTPRAMIDLLSYAHQTSWGSAFHASLPVAGESELLRHRMKQTPAQGNLHAKTGTTNTVAALAGYVTARDGEVLAFSFMYNGRDLWNAKLTMDQIGATLASFVRE